MSNHVHLIAKVRDESISLTDIIRDIKRFSANEIYKVLISDKNESRRIARLPARQGFYGFSNLRVSEVAVMKILRYGGMKIIL